MKLKSRDTFNHLKSMSGRLFILFLLIGAVPGQSVSAKELSLQLKKNRFSDRDLLGQRNASEGNSRATLRILAIRVDFQEDDNPLTTGNGKFEQENTNFRLIDAPPHDLGYFENQLSALANYFRTVSNGQLILEFDVFPSTSVETFTVSQPMNFYVPAGDDALLDTRLAEFFQEAFRVADASAQINFQNYDSFIIFHAGVGGDFAFDFDPTPQDMPSVFLDTKTLRKELGNDDPTYEGVAVSNGSFFIKDGIILPETQTQEDIPIGLLGTMSIMFGNQLGLPILFNPDNGRAGVGVFGLMDQGSGNFFGLLPAQPSAWEKVFLGWEQPIEIIESADIPIAAPGAKNSNKIYKVPITPNEYFLIENRNRDLFNDDIAVGHDANGERVEFIWNDEVGQAIRFDTTRVNSLAVITRVDEYDFGLPGSGILIWHIDETVINANFSENRVNANPDFRGIDLEEADGAQDIGQFYNFLSAGAGAENGVIEDMFWGSNIVNICVNHSDPSACFDSDGNTGGSVQFTPFSKPSSLSNSGANTNIYITDFSEPDTIMTFSVSNALLQAGFPISTGPGRAPLTAPVVVDLDGNSQKEIVVANTDGKLFVWKSNGSKFLDSGVENGIIADLNTRSFAPAVANAAGQTTIIITSTAQVRALQPNDADNNGLADVRFEYTHQGTISTAPLVLNNSAGWHIIVGTEQGSITSIASDGTENFSVDADGTLLGFAELPDVGICFTSQSISGGVLGLVSEEGLLVWSKEFDAEFVLAPVVADLDQDGSKEVIAISTAPELLVVNESGQIMPGFPRVLEQAARSQLVVGNIDNDDYLELVFLSNSGLEVLNHLGFSADNFPVTLQSIQEGSDSENRRRSPILADLNGDGEADIVFGDSNSSITAYDSRGRILDGFPISSGDAFLSAPSAADLDDDNDLELTVTTNDGFVYIYDLGTSPAFLPWPGFLANEKHSNLNDAQNEVTPLSGNLLSQKTVYNYPNPTDGDQTTIRYTLTEDAEVRIKIFDLAGAKVDELVGPGFGQGENEVTWSLTNIESGVYLARVEAQSQQNKDVAMIKIAVVK